MSRSVAGYAFFDHTADIGIEAWGATWEALLTQLGRGLTELIAEDSALKSQQQRRVALEADDPESLILAWLNELLYLFSAKGFLPVDYAFDSAGPKTVRATLSGEIFDPARHAQGREVKAITRHALSVVKTPTGWQARVIVDI